jgi:hypothetical protein
MAEKKGRRPLADSAVPRTTKIRGRVRELRATFATSPAARCLIPESLLE